MGIEYTILLDESDHKCIRESVPRDDPKSIDELLKRLHGYIKGSKYEYENGPQGYNSAITIDGQNLQILVYGSASEEPIIQTLYSYLMDMCGRFRIKEL